MDYEYLLYHNDITINAVITYENIETGSGSSEFWGATCYESKKEIEIKDIELISVLYNEKNITGRFNKIILNYLYSLEEQIINEIINY